MNAILFAPQTSEARRLHQSYGGRVGPPLARRSIFAKAGEMSISPLAPQFN
jgi:hypothetical protein